MLMYINDIHQIFAIQINVCNPSKTLRHFQLRSDMDCNRQPVAHTNNCDNTKVYNPTLATLRITAHACTIQQQPYKSYQYFLAIKCIHVSRFIWSQLSTHVAQC